MKKKHIFLAAVFSAAATVAYWAHGKSEKELTEDIGYLAMGVLSIPETIINEIHISQDNSFQACLIKGDAVRMEEYLKKDPPLASESNFAWPNLLYAIQMDRKGSHHAAIKALVAHGAKVDLVYEQETPLIFAAKQRKAGVVKLLLQYDNASGDLLRQSMDILRQEDKYSNNSYGGYPITRLEVMGIILEQAAKKNKSPKGPGNNA